MTSIFAALISNLTEPRNDTVNIKLVSSQVLIASKKCQYLYAVCFAREGNEAQQGLA